MPPLNPFFHRGPVREPDYFFGRGAEQAYIADLVRQGQSVSISGQRRVGKTSLLFHLAHPSVSAQWGLAEAPWVYLDGGTLDGLDEDWFFGAVDRALGGEADAVPYARFLERVRAAAARDQRLILLLDEFELIAANPRFGSALFNRLRGLAAQYPLTFITASRDPLLQLTFAHADTLSSPFFNIFAPVRLGPLAEAEARALLTTLSSRGGSGFDAEALTWILTWAGTLPLFVQVVAYRVFAACAEGAPAWDSIRTQLLADLEQHLRYYWANLDAEAQYTLAALPLLDPAAAAPPALIRLREAALAREMAYNGRALEVFVRDQKVEGLLHGGPLVLDVRRGLVAVEHRPIHLTPTEFAALRMFLERPGEIFTPEAIETALWPGEVITDPERARGVIKKLRAALGSAGEAIVNRRGQGYLLVTGAA
jgi:hypothetical protein